jgi:hypothetical protein
MKYSKGLTMLLLISLAFITSSYAVMDASCMDPPAMPSNMPVPSVPDFDLKYVDHSYEVPAATTSHTDPYTGKVTTETQPAYHVKNFTIDVIINNQNFQETIQTKNGEFDLVMKYAIRWKGSFQQDWPSTGRIYDLDVHAHTGTTTFSIPADYFTPEGTVDFQVQAVLGYYTQEGLLLFAPYFQSRSGEWSSTKSITLPASTTSPTIPTTSPIETTQTPVHSMNPSFNFVAPAIVVAIVVVLGSCLVVYDLKKHKSV